ncbi:MAG TPA: STAS domain-containing protein [Vicinamibacterales bacterium]|nr:STAS domain-containing protein [Vicinamibacterales bacterium]
MTIDERTVGDVTVLGLGGRLVLYDGEADFRQTIEQLISSGRRKILIDLQDVTYIDSAGVGVLVGKYLSVRRQGGDMKLLHLSSRSLRVMTITRLTSVFESFDSEEAALSSFSGETASH